MKNSNKADEIEDKKTVESNVSVNQDEDPNLDNETPLIAVYDLKKRSLYKVNGNFHVRIETGYPFDYCGGDGDFDDEYSYPLTKEEAVYFLRCILGSNANDRINEIMGEKVDRIKVSKEAKKNIDRLWNNG